MQTLNKKTKQTNKQTCRCSVSKLCPKTRQMNLYNLLKWTDFILGGLQNHCRWWLQPWNEKTLTLWKKRYDQPPWILKSRDITLPTKVHLVKAMVFPVVIYGCESWIIKKAELQRIYTFELWCWRRLENPLDCKEIQPVHPKGDHSWILIGTTHVESETPVLWLLHVKNQLIGKDPDAGKDWRWEEKGTTENEMVWWHHWLNGHEFE